MTAPTVAPTTEQTGLERDRLFHFACCRIRLVAFMTGTPVHCLCGAVHPGTRPGAG